jgi:Uma2 family endonuclease
MKDYSSWCHVPDGSMIFARCGVTSLAQAKTKPATYPDIEALPAQVVGEIAFGILHTQPRPAPRHARATTRMASELDLPFDRGRGGPGGWIILIEPELHLGPHVIVPDVAGWRRDRMPRLPDTTFIELAPDWVCEVLSPTTQRFDRTDKLAIYAKFGVEHCWYVDPNARTLEVFARQGEKWLIAATFKDGDAVTAPPFEAHTFALDLLWSDAGS